MQPFLYQRASNEAGAVAAAAAGSSAQRVPPTSARAQFIAGGTLLLDLMKLGAMQPEVLVDINDLRASHAAIEAGPQGLRLGALAHMSEVAEHPAVLKDYPVLAQALQLAASAQLRNMATLGGNVLQRTRCQYFREPGWGACNKRTPGSGCAALEGVNRKHAVLGVSEACIAEYPGDFGPALAALGASVETVGPNGARTIAFDELHKSADTPHDETVLAPGELITLITVPAGAWTRRSLYLKIRDRQSYEFAVASAAVALDMTDGTVNEARIGLGGVAYRPWRARDAEAALRGKTLNEATAAAAAEAAFSGARPRKDNAYKIDLGRRTLVRALLEAANLQG